MTVDIGLHVVGVWTVCIWMFADVITKFSQIRRFPYFFSYMELRSCIWKLCHKAYISALISTIRHSRSCKGSIFSHQFHFSKTKTFDKLLMIILQTDPCVIVMSVSRPGIFVRPPGSCAYFVYICTFPYYP